MKKGTANIVCIMGSGFVHQFKANDRNYEQAMAAAKRQFMASQNYWQHITAVAVDERIAGQVHFTGEYDERTDTVTFHNAE